MSTYQCLDFFYVIDVIKSILWEKHFFKKNLQHSTYKKEETYLFSYQNVRWKETRETSSSDQNTTKMEEWLPLVTFFKWWSEVLALLWTRKEIEQLKNFYIAFIVGCTIFHISALKDH